MEEIRLIWLAVLTVKKQQEAVLCSLEAADREKAGRFLREEDRFCSLGGSWLIRQYVGPSAVIRIGSRGKPLAASGWFNLSHSGGWIGLALAREPVGLDIQQVLLPDPALEAFCLREEEKTLLAGNPASVSFTDLFASKEALTKAEGSGLPDDLPSVPALPLDEAVFWQGKTYYRKHIRRGDCAVSLCLQNSDFTLREEEIDEIRE